MTDMFYWAENVYKAYGDKVKWKNYHGESMPKWDDLPLAIKVAWETAILAVLENVNLK